MEDDERRRKDALVANEILPTISMYNYKVDPREVDESLNLESYEQGGLGGELPRRRSEFGRD